MIGSAEDGSESAQLRMLMVTTN
uniref:Uncharacterized protein n=1 Tax=Arundo donax TaxID=35708 RepID=A0A0A9H974_ARUDO